MNFIFPSTLIISNSENKVFEFIQKTINTLEHSIENNPDIFQIQEYTIDQVRGIKSFLSKKPFSHNSKIVIIQDIDKLNVESQNALLKTLEEPGEGNYIILSTTNSSSILPTILSRCQIIKIIEQSSLNYTPLLTISKNLSQNFLQSEELTKNKDQIIPYLQDQINLYHQELLKKPDKHNSQMILKLQKAVDMIKSNVDPKSAIDYLFLS